MADGACVGYHNPDAFFVNENASGVGMLEWVEAKKICNDCPVRVECLRWAIDEHVTYGMWGGLTAPQRKSLGHLVDQKGTVR